MLSAPIVSVSSWFLVNNMLCDSIYTLLSLLSSLLILFISLLISAGDQGFLNSYYSDFPNAHVFEPDLSSDAKNSIPVPEMQRLSTLYNADVGLYMLANKVISW